MAVLGCEGLWCQGEVGQAARVKPCGDGQGQGDSCHCSLGLKGPPWGSGDPGHWGQLVSKAPFRPSWAPSCVSGNQAWPLPWMLGPRGESPAQGPCRSCDFLRAGRLQKLLWMWSGVQSVRGPWSAPPEASSNYHPKSGLSLIPRCARTNGGGVWSKLGSEIPTQLREEGP